MDHPFDHRRRDRVKRPVIDMEQFIFNDLHTPLLDLLRFDIFRFCVVRFCVIRHTLFHNLLYLRHVKMFQGGISQRIVLSLPVSLPSQW